ncbi:glycerophosphodiester phosphodiesterase [Adhaeribacter radiodurans]|uniref:Glycerophosphodiester phosphodiesterase n=1 Tax=Adhaeribacter radiodurans TaxID=2745197 RepID=A0A7L7LCW4_9BACT|nr:glycerophosphodiester phosphodiesterase family protein [Adhaeribacter radiodurans]QMU30219.1 glycerophosphodiester phosphodiesterase [Adhaeribacter radiodurans]
MNGSGPKQIVWPRKLWLLLLIVGISTALFFVYDFIRFKQQIKVLTPEHRKVVIIGHAGRAFFSPFNPFNPLPPNSLASLLKALREDGADGLEVDVHVSRDGVPVLYHDETLNTMSEGKGKIENLPAASVIGLAYKGGWPYDFFHQEKIISLEDLLRELQKLPEFPDLHLDLRNYTLARDAYFARSVLGVLRKFHYPVEKLIIVYAKPELLDAFRVIEPRVKLLLDIGPDFEGSLKTILANRLHGLVAEGKQINVSQIKLARYYNLQVVLFGGKARNTIYKMVLLQPDAIEVNNIKALRKIVR